MHIFRKGEPIPLNKMGMSAPVLGAFRDMITSTYGLVLVVGPSRNGINTTIRSTLEYLNKPETKIWTIEHPVEETHEGIRQIDISSDAGPDFAQAIKSVLLGDPDIIAIQEIRDGQMANLAMEAALRGGLVLSRLPARSSAEAVTGILETGVSARNFSNAFVGVLCQGFFRTLCNECKKAYHPSWEEYNRLIQAYGTKEFERDLAIPHSAGLKFCKPDGCYACAQTGYQGMMPIYELLRGTPELKRMIAKNSDTEALFLQGLKDGHDKHHTKCHSTSF